MTDPDLIAKKLAHIETCVRELETLARPERIAEDVREERFVEYTLQIAIQAALDITLHIVSDERLGEPSTNREAFSLLGRGGWLPKELAETMQDIVGFRNVLVHGYLTVDRTIVRAIVEHRLGDLLGFVAAIRARLPP